MRELGADHVIDVGGPSTLPQSIEAVKIGGHVAMIGLHGGMEAEIPMIPVFAKQSDFKVVSTEAGRIRPIWSSFWPRMT
ncbi:zinc-binding dehydrogenase [Paracoccus wurundjeri]|uniref:zinc-binding dehydrogenase n=1 Tax=Paracoccus onubensis TaxID=1675788 RepID=UPI00351D40B2